MGYYYWAYRDHPHSNQDFSYEGIVYARNDHTANSQVNTLLEDIEEDNKNIEFDLGVQIVMPIDEIIEQEYAVEDASDLDPTEYSDRNLQRLAREHLTEEDILEVANRQERIDREQMGEDVDGIISLEFSGSS